MSTRLYYVVDPMCSWCYGFAPALKNVKDKLRDGVTMELVMGGLAPDSDVPMDEQTKGYVQHAWRAVEEQTGVPFNHDFWTKCAPRRSTYPSCRAVILARKQGLEWEMLKAIQSAYYLEARNPSDADTLMDLAEGLGMDSVQFAHDLESNETQQQLKADFDQRRKLGATSFPSIGISVDGTPGILCAGYLDGIELQATFRASDLL